MKQKPRLYITFVKPSRCVGIGCWIYCEWGFNNRHGFYDWGVRILGIEIGNCWDPVK